MRFKRTYTSLAAEFAAFQAEPKPPCEKATELAQLYHDETEAFDQQHCSLKDDKGVAMPASYREFVFINANALKVRAKVEQMANDAGVPLQELRREIARIGAQT